MNVLIILVGIFAISVLFVGGTRECKIFCVNRKKEVPSVE